MSTEPTVGKRLRTNLQPSKQIDVLPAAAITKLTIIPTIVNGRIELTFEGLPEGSKIAHIPLAVTPADTPRA